MPLPSVKLELSSSWLRGSPVHSRWWIPHPAGASGRKHRSGGSICAGRTELLLHTLLWYLHRSNLGAQETIVLTTGIQSGMIVQFILTKHSLLGQEKTQIRQYPGPGGVLESSSICVGTEKAETKLSFDARWAHDGSTMRGSYQHTCQPTLQETRQTAAGPTAWYGSSKYLCEPTKQQQRLVGYPKQNTHCGWK